MINLIIDPKLPSGSAEGGFVQTIRARDRGQDVGVARWHVRHPAEGIVQILELSVVRPAGRQGIGGRLIETIFAQSQRYFVGHKTRLRRVWIIVDQKTQVIGRSFLTRHAFHHVASVDELLPKQSAMIYMRSFD
jgi:hypothetical protein